MLTLMVKNISVMIDDLYQGMWDCEADDNNELSFKRGQIVHVISKVQFVVITTVVKHLGL